MKLHFDPNQPYQHDAINSIVGIFEGQPLNSGDFGFSFQYEGCLLNKVGIGNRLLISEEQILKNVQAIQRTNEIDVSDYFVAETKSAGQELKISDKRKIQCGQANFNEFEDVKYKQVTTVGDLD